MMTRVPSPVLLAVFMLCALPGAWTCAAADGWGTTIPEHAAVLKAYKEACERTLSSATATINGTQNATCNFSYGEATAQSRIMRLPVALHQQAKDRITNTRAEDKASINGLPAYTSRSAAGGNFASAFVRWVRGEWVVEIGSGGVPDGNPTLIRDVLLSYARKIDDAIAGAEPESEIERSILFVLDQTFIDATAADDDYREATWSAVAVGVTKELAQLADANRRATAQGEDLTEWAILGFDATNMYLHQSFRTTLDESWHTRAPSVEPYPQDASSFEWAVTYALIYLHTHAEGEKRALVPYIVKPDESSENLFYQGRRVRWLHLCETLKKMQPWHEDWSAPDEDAPQARSHPTPSIPMLLLPMALVGQSQLQLVVPGETFEQALKRLEALAALSGAQTKVSTFVVAVQPGSVLDGLLRELSGAGGGSHVAVPTMDDYVGDLAQHLTDLLRPPPDTIAPAAPAQPSPTAGNQAIVCTDIVNGQPQGAADAFGSVNKLHALVRLGNTTAGALADVAWQRGGQTIYTDRFSLLAGATTIAARLDLSALGGFPAGAWELVVTSGTSVLARKPFTVGPSAAVPAPSPTPAPVPPPATGTVTGAQVLGMTVSGLQFSAALAADMRPTQAAVQFPSDAGRIYASFDYSGATAGTPLTVNWQMPGGGTSTPVSVKADAAQGRIACYVEPGAGQAFAGGQWLVTVARGAEVLASGGFTVADGAATLGGAQVVAPAQTAATLVVCQGIANGQPFGAATSFTTPYALFAVLSLPAAPEQGLILVEWSRNGKAFETDTVMVTGLTWLPLELVADGDGPLPPGQYQVRASVDGANVATAQFEIK